MLSTNNRLSLKSRLITLSFSRSVQYVGNNRTIGISGCCLPSCYVCSICPFMLFVPLTFPACLLLKLIKYHPTVLFISLWAVHDDFCHCCDFVEKVRPIQSPHLPTLPPFELFVPRVTLLLESKPPQNFALNAHSLSTEAAFQSFLLSDSAAPSFLFLWQTSSRGPGL